MSDKLNCFECKNWFDVNELIYLPTEQYYLCHHDAATHYAIKCENLRAERDEARAVVEAAWKIMDEIKENWIIEYLEDKKYDTELSGGVMKELAAALARVDGEK